MFPGDHAGWASSLKEGLRAAAGGGILRPMTQARPPGGTTRTARFWYRWFAPAA
jgi:hypothetical protein